MNARALALLPLLLWIDTAAAEVPVPALSARVTDLTGTLSADQREALETRLAAFERAVGSQVAVLIVPTTQPETIEQFGIRVADAWKIGREGIDDGVILLVAKDDRALRIEVGYGLEGALPDAIAKRIIDEVIVPRFRDGDFYGGVAAGVERIVGVIEGEPLPPPARRSDGGRAAPPVEQLWLLLFVPLAAGAAVRRLSNRLVGAAVAGGVAAGLAWWWTGQAIAIVVLGLFCFFLVLVASATGRIGRRGWSSGGGSWGGGGFSGGGGGFGGGGASGRW